MKKFEVGAMYWDTSAVDHNDVMVIKITRRTEKSVWFVRMRGDQPEGEPARTKIFTNATYEYIMPYRYSMAPVWDADRKVEPEADEESAEAEQAATEAAPSEKKEGKDMKFTKVTIKKIARENGIDLSVFDINKRGGKYYIDIRYPYESTEAGAYDRVLAAYNATAKKLIDAITAASYVKFSEAGSYYRDAVCYVSEEIDDMILRLRVKKAAQATPEAPANDAPQEAANDEPETADGNKAAAMTAQESAARKMIHEQTTEYLLKTWEGTTANNDPFIPTVRGWLMDELQSRYPEAYDAWLDSEVCEDAALRGYIEAAERAAQDSAEAGEPAPQGDAAPSVYAARNPVAPYDIFRYHPESRTYLFENEGEAALIDALNFHADSGNALSVVNALYEITHDGGGWFSPRNHPVMLDALNSYIEFLTVEIEVFDNFPNEREKEIAVGKLAEAKVIRDAFAADVARAA